jgi:hypothetical protein
MMPSGAATTGGKLRRRPQDILPIAFLNIRPLDTEQPTGNAFETVDHARHRVLRRVVDEQVYVFGLTVHLDGLRLEVSANFLEHDFEPLDSASVKYLSSIFGDEYQVDMQCEHAYLP